MPLLNMSEAARAAGVSRQQLYRLIEAGRISATTRPNGQPGVDTSELLRVFGALQNTGKLGKPDNSQPGTLGQSAQLETVRRLSELEAENRRLQDVLRLTERMLQTAEERLKQADAERAQLMLLIPIPAARQLEHQPTPAAKKTAARKGGKKLISPAKKVASKATKTTPAKKTTRSR